MKSEQAVLPNPFGRRIRRRRRKINELLVENNFRR
jgi:hypothetical protein